MRNSKKGVSVIVGTLLLMFIGVAGSIIIYNAFATLPNTEPDPGTATILEGITISQVTVNPLNETHIDSYTIYFQNTGTVNEIIDAIYVLDAKQNLVAVIPISPIPLAPNEANSTTIPTNGVDTTNWVYFLAYTTRGNSDMLEATPTGPTYFYLTRNPSGAIINNETGLPNLNNTNMNDTITFDTTSDTSSFTAPPIHPSAAWNPVTGSTEVGGGGADIHIQHDGSVACSALIPNPFLLQSLNVSININGPNGARGIYNLSLYNWNTGNNVVVITNKPFSGDFIINYILNETSVQAYVNPNETFVFRLDVTFDRTNTGTLKFDFEDVNIVPTYRGTYNGIFIFNMSHAYDAIESIEIKSRLECNASNTIIQFRIYDSSVGSWEITDNYPLPYANTFGDFDTILTVNCINYVDPVSNQIRIMYAPYSALGGDISIHYDLVELLIVGITN